MARKHAVRVHVCRCAALVLCGGRGRGTFSRRVREAPSRATLTAAVAVQEGPPMLRADGLRHGHGVRVWSTGARCARGRGG